MTNEQLEKKLDFLTKSFISLSKKHYTLTEQFDSILVSLDYLMEEHAKESEQQKKCQMKN